MLRTVLSILFIAWQAVAFANDTATGGGPRNDGAKNDREISALRKEVDRILATESNVEASRHVEPVFRLAKCYLETGDGALALKYYEIGLQYAPWNLEAQLESARLLKAAGSKEQAEERALRVAEFAESGVLLDQAAELLGRSGTRKLVSESQSAQEVGLCLVPVGDAEAWIIWELKKDLESVLPFPVIVRLEPFDVGEPNRHPLYKQIEGTRENLKSVELSLPYQWTLRDMALRPDALKDDETLIRFVKRFLSLKGDTNLLEVFEKDIQLGERVGKQHDADELLERFCHGTAAGETSWARLAIADFDIYSKGNSYLFGLAEIGKKCGIVSYRRFMSSVTGEPPNRDRLKQRILKQALSSIGLMFGLPRCTFPACPRTYSSSLAEHDNKKLELCPTCKSAFADLLKKEDKGIEGLKRAAEAGSADAQFKLATYYLEGMPAPQQSATESIKWYRRAAQQGHARSQVCLGRALENGTGGKVDLAEAYMWYYLAAGQGDAEAQARLADIVAKMSTEQVVDGGRRVLEFTTPKEGHGQKPVGAPNP